MGFQFQPGVRYRMPVVFGPASGPRQKPDGTPWTAEEAGTMNAEWMAVRYRTDPDKLSNLLPPGFSLRGEPIVSVSCAWFKNLYWLAGRGYGILSVDFPVTYVGKNETHHGAFCPVIWEGAPDAILTGREELGFPKLFAEIPEIGWNGDKTAASCQASWMGHKFFDIAISDLEEVHGERTLPGSGGGAQLYFKYQPRTSPFGQEGPDAAYVTTAAPPPGTGAQASNINFDDFEYRRWVGKGEIAWRHASFEQLPLSFHIVNALADLPCLAFVGAEMVTFSGPGPAVALNAMRAVEPA